MPDAAPHPKVFISYSRKSTEHCDFIRSQAERLQADGVEVLLDQWDLAEGQDKYAFMEKMVTDASISHVLIFSDATYAKKADDRAAGVGTESQIISQKLYESVDQKKFIPILCEKTEEGKPYLPVFLGARIWIDFSSPELASESWEQLLRAIYNKPLHEKPPLGKTPSYLLEDSSRVSLPTIGKYNSLHNALLNGKATIHYCRRDFLDTFFQYMTPLKRKQYPESQKFPDEIILDELRALLPLREQLLDWLAIESEITDDAKLESVICNFLENLLALKYPPNDGGSWNGIRSEVHGIFTYEIFLYSIAILLKAEKYKITHELLMRLYVMPDSMHYRRQQSDFDHFYFYSEALDAMNRRLGGRRLNPLADVIHERATNSVVPFNTLMQADLITSLASFLKEPCSRWYPQTLVYAGGIDAFPLPLRATRRKDFQRTLAVITGIASGDEIRTKLHNAHAENHFRELQFNAHVNVFELMNIDKMDTIQ